VALFGGAPILIQEAILAMKSHDHGNKYTLNK
jgi:hypothetical protein